MWWTLAALAGASCLLRIEAAQARAGLPGHRHGGIYALHIATHHGSCHKAYDTKISVSGDHVHATGHALLRGSGYIAGDRVLVTLQLLHHAVHVTGRVHGHFGSGRWSVHALGCGGTWHAARLS
jgi:hypothetical protein